MNTRAKMAVVLAAVLVAVGLFAATAGADERRRSTEGTLLRKSEGLQMPGSESDSRWWFVSYPGEEGLPAVGRMASITGCSDYPEGVMTRLEFDATFDNLGRIRPWMDRGQRKSARGFGRLQRVFHREYGEDLAVYRCDTGEFGQVPIYFVGSNADGLSGLKTVNTET
ncbi:MAG: nuclease A inhibitor family protein [Rubrobacter sp.]